MRRKEALKILGITEAEAGDAALLKRVYRKLSRENHPDVGGDAELMSRINLAYTLIQSGKEDDDDGVGARGGTIVPKVNVTHVTILNVQEVQ